MDKKFQVFISSTYEDLKNERQKVQDIILSMYQIPIGRSEEHTSELQSQR